MSQPARTESRAPRAVDLAMDALRDAHRVRRELRAGVRDPALRPTLGKLDDLTETLTALVRAIEEGR